MMMAMTIIIIGVPSIRPRELGSNFVTSPLEPDLSLHVVSIDPSIPPKFPSTRLKLGQLVHPTDRPPASARNGRPAQKNELMGAKRAVAALQTFVPTYRRAGSELLFLMMICERNSRPSAWHAVHCSARCCCGLHCLCTAVVVVVVSQSPLWLGWVCEIQD